MPTKTYYFDAAHTDAVAVSWGMFFRNFRLEYQGRDVGGGTTAQELKAGKEFALPDGRQLRVRLQQQFGAQGLDMQLDGRPLPGTVNDPHTQVQTGFVALLFIAVLNVALSLVALFGHVEVLEKLGLGWAAIGEAALYAGLAGLGKYRLAAAAFYAALALLVLDGVLLLGTSVATGGLVVRVFLGMAVYRAAGAARQLRSGAAALPVS